MGLGGEVFPTLGPFPIGDRCGVAIACIMMQHSLKPGISAKTIQFETFRKPRLVHVNSFHANYFGTGDSTMQDNGNGSRVSHAVTNLVWFKRFVAGCHCRMGDVWLPDKAVSNYVIGGCFCVLERDWSDIWDLDKDNVFTLHRVVTAACVIIARYFGGLRGEEINKVDLSVTRKHWKGSTGHVEHAYIPLMLSGKFKKQKGRNLFCQPLTLVTKGGRHLEQ